ncbi:MAG: hypothetical protein LKKZDAJK_002493 [Candidatus Fervidibacter sp.]
MKKIFRRSGFSLPEIIVVISIIATLLVIILPIIGNVKRRVYAHQCASQLKQIGIALKLYEQDFGALPYFLDKLAPFYVSPSLLICPWVKANIPQQIFEKCVDLEKAIREGSYLSTYFYFYQPSLDDFYRRGIVPISYSHILQMRGDATPIVYCREHRHPYIIVCHPKLFRPRWFFPEAPIVVLRRDGSVSLSYKGSTSPWIDTLVDALTL